MSTLLQALAALEPLLEPVVKQEFDNIVVPELQKLVNGIGSPDLKILAGAVATAIASLGDKEIPAVAAKI